jgi:uncharacterized protein (DUF885 family)
VSTYHDDGNRVSGLQGLIDSWIAEEMARSPVRATVLGYDGFDDQLGGFRAEDFEAQSRSDRAWHDRFAAAAAGEGEASLAIDRELILSTLRGRQVMDDWQAWRRDPSVYLDPGLTGVNTLFLHGSRPLPELVADAASRLDQVPEAVAAAIEQLDAGLLAPVLRDRALGQCSAAANYARQLLPAQVPEEAGRARLAEAGAAAAAAFVRLGEHLDSLEPAGTYAIGEQRYSALLGQKEMLAFGADGLHQRGEAAWADLDRRMEEVSAHLGHAHWRQGLEEINRRHPATPDEMLEAYRSVTARCRRFLIERDLVTMPDGEECAVVPSPLYQRPVLAVASYSAPPAFKPSRSGYFFVPFPPDGASAEQIHQRMATNSYASMATIAAHEAYPGHHWHLVWMQAHASRVRSVIRSAYFTEGWGLFAEHIMGEAGFFENDEEWLGHLDARIFRAARIVVDTALHSGEMSFDAAVEHMHSHTGLSAGTARAEVVRYCAWPTQAASYLTGALELERIRRRYVAEGRGSARRFNDEVAATGSLPLGLAEQAVMAG